jgi:predicted CoA-substrate-specific enzyme activase
MHKHYLGIDCGSVSIKGVIINEEGAIIKSYYTRNTGLIDTTKELMQHLDSDYEIVGVGVTGSGREFVSLLIGADVTESEIICHYVATTFLVKGVSTIMDIGGEDSKLITVSNNNISYFSMNNACGGGTGSMIEAIAGRLGIKTEDIGRVSLKSRNRVSIPSKCGVFAQSAVVSKLNNGVLKEDIMMGTLRGLVGNYFTMLAKGKDLKPPFVFQGATAKNIGLIKCFEEELGNKVFVPQNPELMGALGVALLTSQDFESKTSFAGFRIKDKDFRSSTYYGTNCSNECEITKIFVGEHCIGCVGNRCEKCLNER